jgi:phage terminase large subunit
MGRAELETLKKTTLVTFFDAAKDLGLQAGRDYVYNAQEKTITWVRGGAQILLYDLAHYPSDPLYDRLGSLEITGAFVDEVGQITFRCYETVKSRIRYKLDAFGLIPKFLGTGNPVKTWPYGEFYRPAKEMRLPLHRKFVRALPTDNPFLPQSYIDSLKNMKDKAQKERLLYGNWEYDDDPSALFPIDVIADMFTTRAPWSDQKYVIGDVSRQGRDRMVLGYWEGLQCREIVEVPYEIRSNTRDAEEYIRSFANERGVRNHHILLDEDGIGGGHVDHLDCLGFVNNASPIITFWEKESQDETGRKVNYANLKSQCYFLFSQKAANGEIGITCEPGIQQLVTEELEQIKRKDADKDGKVSVLGKDTIKDAIGRSPDFADMLMMRMRFELAFGEIAGQPEFVPSLVTGGLLSREY